ncbi:MAG: polar amino acid ABC transporter permease [Rhizobiales bacterium]|nr:polar amino acid ABC transporter permease [Hyphomicrobiales bacterium]MBA68443.1 polar amino acid ABC transporter permease [Hyphomicrobiales bacterium]|tara:strand:+ start:125 stop:928 length:804 start_codon:yes stop_codon:yes gene_type:complete
MNSELRTFLLGIVGVPLCLLGLFAAVYGDNTGAMLGLMAERTPTLLTGSPDITSLDGGFLANIAMSIIAMAIAAVGGVILGVGLIAEFSIVRHVSDVVMNVLRNSPWLVVLYAMLYLLPFEVEIFGVYVTISPFIKSVIGLSLPVAANIAEIFRGGIQAIPSAQWESARSLGYRRLQILRHIILPQALPLMIPNLMTIYAMLFIGTSLVVVTGASDILSAAKVIIATTGSETASGFYIYILFLFFLFAFPIAILTRCLERRIGSVSL